MSFANAFAAFAQGAGQGSQWAMQTISAAEDVKEKRANREKREREDKFRETLGEAYKTSPDALGIEPPPPGQAPPAEQPDLGDRLWGGVKQLIGWEDTPAPGAPGAAAPSPPQAALPAPAAGPAPSPPPAAQPMALPTVGSTAPLGGAPAAAATSALPVAGAAPPAPAKPTAEQHIREIVTGENLPSPGMVDAVVRADTGVKPGEPIRASDWDSWLENTKRRLAEVDPMMAEEWYGNMGKTLQSNMIQHLKLASAAMSVGDIDTTIKKLRQGYQFMPDGLDVDLRPGTDGKSIVVQRMTEDCKPVGDSITLDAEGVANLVVQLSDPGAYSTLLRQNREFAHKQKVDTETLALRKTEVEGQQKYQQGMLGVSQANAAEAARHNKSMEALKEAEIAAGLEAAKIKATAEGGLDVDDIRAADKMVTDFFSTYAWPEGVSDTAKRSAPSIANGMYRAMGGRITPSSAAEAAIGLVTNPKNLFWSPDGKTAYVTTPEGAVQVPDMAARMIQSQLDLALKQQADRDDRDERQKKLEAELAARRARSTEEGAAIPVDPAEDVLRRRGLM
jgi:hypothetical protein